MAVVSALAALTACGAGGKGGGSGAAVPLTPAASTSPTPSPSPSPSGSPMPDSIAIVSGDAQTATVGAAEAAPVVVLVKDSIGNPAPGVSVTFAVTGGGGSVTPGIVTTDAAGHAQTTWTFGTTAGAQTLLAGRTGTPLPGSPPVVAFSGTAVAGVTTQLLFSTPPSSTAQAGTAFSTSPTIGGFDTYGNFASSYSGSVTLAAYTNSGCSTPAPGVLSATTNPVTASAGVAAFSALTYSLAGTIYIGASASGVTSVCSSAITVSSGVAAKLAYFIAPSTTATAGAALSTQPTVVVQDSLGNSVTTGSSSITLGAYTDAACSTAASGTLNAASNPVASSAGLAAFSSVSYTQVGTIYLKASSAGLTSVCSAAITVSPAAATKLSYFAQPSSVGIAGTALATAPTIEIQDALGNRATSASNSITLAAYTDSGCSAAATGTLSATSNPLSATSGLATFAGVTYTKAETIYLKASSAGLTSACSGAIVISPAAAADLVYAIFPSSSVSAGSDLAVPPTLAVRDLYGNTVTSSSASITLGAYTDAACSTAASGTLNAATNPLSASAGSAAFSNVNYSLTGTIYLKASSTGLTSACSGAITVNAASATQLAFFTQPSSTATAGAALAAQPAVEVRDVFSNRVTSATTSITLAAYTDSGCSTAATGTFTATTNPLSATSGLATFAGVSYTKAETIYLKATAAGLTSACSSAIVVSPDVASQLVYSVQPSATATAGVALTTQPTLQVLDAFGNSVISNSTAITLAAYTDISCSTAGTGTFSATTNPVTTSGGIAGFLGVSYTKAETIYLKATATGLTSSCSSAIAVAPGAATKLSFFTQPSATANAGATFATQPSVEVQDAYANRVITATNTIALAAFTNSGCTTAATGTLSATTNPLAATTGLSTFAGASYTKAETIYVQAFTAGLTSTCSSAIVVSPAAGSVLSFFVQPGLSATAGAALATQPVVEVQDSMGNRVTTATNSITLAAYTNSGCTTAATGTFAVTTNPLAATAGLSTFAGVSYTKAESLYIKASAAGLTSTCSTAVTVAPAAPSQLGFSVQPSATGTAGAALSTQPSVQVLDAFGNLVNANATSITLAAFTNSGCSTSAPGITGATTNPVVSTAGVSAFAGVFYTKAQTIYFGASASGLTAACSTAVAISPDIPSKLVYFTQPASSGTAGAVLGTQPAVEIQDGFSNWVTTATDSITVSAYTDSGCTTAATGTLSATTNPLSAVAGLANFAGLSYTKAETIYVKASAFGLTSTCSLAIAVAPAAGTALSFFVQPSSSAIAATAFTTQPQVEVQDSLGNRATTATNSITLAAYTDSGCTTASTGTFSATTNPLAATSGLSTFAGVKHTKAETIYIKATAAGLTSACSTATAVAPGAASVLAFFTQPSTTGTAGTALTIQPAVEVRDASGNRVTTATNSITLAAYTNVGCSTASTGTFSATTNPLAATSGLSTFAGAKHTKAETIYIGASAAGLTAACSTAIVVSPAAANTLAYSVVPSTTGMAGTNLATPPTVAVRDAYGNTVTSSSASITLSAASDSGCTTAAGGVLNAATNPLAASSGLSAFTSVNYTATGTIYLKAASAGLTTACSAALVVSAGAATQLAFSTQPSSTATATVNFTTQPVVQVRDALGNLVSSASNSITLAAFTDSGCATAATGTFAATTNPLSASSGVATFAGVNYSKAETVYLKASTAGLSTACSSGIVVSAGAATQLAFSVQPANANATATISPAIVVQARDAGNNLATTFTGTVSMAIAANPGSGTLSGTTSVSASAGVATFSTLSINKSGTGYTLNATASGLTSGVSSTFNINAGAATQLAFGLQPTNAAAGNVIAPAVQVQALDAGGNLSSFSGNITVAIGTNPGSGTLTGTLTVAASAGTATFSTLSIDKSGTGYTLGATSAGLTSSTSTTFNIISGAPDDANSTIAVSPSSLTANNTATATVTITLIDAFGNPCVGTAVNFASDGTGDTLVQPGSVTNSSGVATGTIKSTVAEDKDLTISLPAGLTSDVVVTFVAGPAAVANSTIVPTPATGIAANGTSTATVTITLADAFNNPVTGVSTTFAATGTGNTLVQPAAVTDANGQATGTIASTVAATKTLSIATPSGLTTVTSTVTFIVSTVSATNSTIVATGPVTANGVSTSSITITLKDGSNLPVAGQTPTFTATNSGADNSYSSCTVSNASGISTCTMTSNTAESKIPTIASPITKAGTAVLFTKDLEVPIDMLDVGIIGLASATTWERSRTSLDPTLYDGTVTHTFEVTCTNTDTVARAVGLVDSGGTARATLNIPASTSVPTRISATWTPNAAASNYRFTTPASGTLVTCYTARMIVRQVGATKTRLYFPLTGGDYASASNVTTGAGAAFDSRTGDTTYTQTTPSRYGLFLKNATDYGVIAAGSPWTFEGVMNSTSGTPRLRLVNAGNAGTVSTLSGTTTIGLVSANFATTATNFTDGANMQVVPRISVAAQTVYAYRAGLWVTLSAIKKGQVFYRIAKSITTAATPDVARAQVDLTHFTNGTAYYEATGMDPTAGTSSLVLQTVGVNDSGTAGASTIGSSTINFTTTTKTRTRSSALSLTNGDRFVPMTSVTSGTQTITESYIVVTF